jgi:ABC-2 type transport system permease protein
MGNLLLIYRKEMRSYFALPIGSVLLLSAALLFGLMTYAARNDGARAQLMGPIFSLTRFEPPARLLREPAVLVVGLARVMALILIPLVTMRLFPEERQMRTMEMLLTSPVTETDIVLGKWLGALTLFLMVLGVSVAELIAASPWHSPDWGIILLCYSVLAAVGASLISIGEYASIVTRHQSAAAGGSLMVCWAAFRYFDSGLLRASDAPVLAALTMAGWFATRRSIRALRNAF